MTSNEERVECGHPHPRMAGVTCTQTSEHLYEHVSFEYPFAGQWAQSTQIIPALADATPPTAEEEPKR
jgi:hypothetical protein